MPEDSKHGSALPGNSDLPIGSSPGNADLLIGSSPGNADLLIGSSPGNADLLIGSSGSSQNANREIGVPRRGGGGEGKKEEGKEEGKEEETERANQEIGDPGETERANRETGDPRGWHCRGYLPHFDGQETTQHVTFHLADSLPAKVVAWLERRIEALPAEKQDLERRRKIEAWIDAGHGSCVLREPAVAAMVQNALLFFDGQRYRLLAWVVMPNHVHVLFQPMGGWTMASIVGSWKKFRQDASVISARLIPGTPISRLAL